ncbi:DUF4153 domain-containing protein [Mangrovibrevibacter kandeliae]|uniref:DUF4153 domain-containing protein n=1 Tax=Mangrovibrevibacter kandeliae TaxID=2968473 RepID=UPI002118449B|nr:DUF4153 domain-containing protein [Aurantimonas sp. CSK15Z-1]MCQ8781768.1 DUF4153 domain-containing protein [Aurantimonas sp. CSK15Z-1]
MSGGDLATSTGRRSRVRRTVDAARAAAISATGRFPVAVACIFGVCLLANLLVEEIDLDGDVVYRLLTTLFGAAIAATIARLVAESRQVASRRATVLSAVAGLVAGAAIGFADHLGLSRLVLLPAAFALIPVAPFARRGTPRDFWQFAVIWGAGLCLSVLSALLFAGGMSAVLALARFLLEIDLPGRIDAHVWATALTLIAPLFALSRLPHRFDRLAASGPDDPVSPGLRTLVDWVAMPLVCLLALVIHAYAVKVLVGSELPKGEIGWIVSLYLCLVMLVRIAIDPFLRASAGPRQAFARFWVAILIVPALLLGDALWLRIAAEGVTVPRYVIGAGLLATALVIAAQALPRWRGDVRLIYALPLLVFALGAFGPWGAVDVSGRSQAARIAALLTPRSNGDAAFVEPASLSAVQRQELNSRLWVLAGLGQLRRVVPLAPQARREALEREIRTAPDNAAGVLVALGIDPDSAAPTPSVRRLQVDVDAPFDVSGYDMLAPDLPLGAAVATNDASGTGPTLRIDGDALVVRFAGVEDRLVWQPAVATLPRTLYDSGRTPQPAAPLLDLVSAGGRHVRLRVTRLLVEEASGRVTEGSLGLLLRRAEWPVAQEPSLGGGRERARP